MIIKYPVKNMTISQPFGRDTTNDPEYKTFYTIFDNKHCGVDFDVPSGTKVYASFAGIIVRNENHKGMGSVIGVRNGNIVSLYAHLSSNKVKVGDIIKEGDLIGISGDSGKACTKPHLHFEVRDITKSSLKEMVFDPPFDQELTNYKEIFEYTVNNKNTIKTLKSISTLFYGTEERWKLLKEKNNFSYDAEEVLRNKLKVTIPNFQRL